MEAFLEPLSNDIHPIGNPSLNYRTYLAEPFFFIMFQIVILITIVYALGNEKGHSKEWLEMAGGDILIATMGKLLPYMLAFVASGLASLYILYGISHLELGDSLWGLVAAMVGLVAASSSLALFLYSLVPSVGLVISAVSMVGSLGATLSGVTFPLASMYPIFRYLALALPIRHFTVIVQNQLYTSGGFGVIWWHAVVLAAFCLLPLLTLRLLHRSIISDNYETLA